jgi:hypothetical protein
MTDEMKAITRSLKHGPQERNLVVQMHRLVLRPRDSLA